MVKEKLAPDFHMALICGYSNNQQKLVSSGDFFALSNSYTWDLEFWGKSGISFSRPGKKS